MKISAIIVALNEAEFIQPCIKAIYPFVDRIKVQTGYDRSWGGTLVTPDQTVAKILAIPDPEGKISLHISRFPDEAIARNWLMRTDGYSINHNHNSTTSDSTKINSFCKSSDYFWIIDGDEIYDPATIPNILNYLEIHKPKILRIRGITYFKSWNYQISPSDNFFHPGLIQAGVLFQENRNLCQPQLLKLLNRCFNNKYWRFDKVENLIQSFLGESILPEEIGVFHHASYVGNETRMTKKIFNSVHYDQRMADWYENIWRKWSPEMKNLHPLNPPNFGGVTYIATKDLPKSIKDQEWEVGYLEPI
jgi:hypothetical protein